MPAQSDSAVLHIPNYRLIKRVGRGAFGEVWLAEEVLTRIYRAVKVIPSGSLSKQRVELEGVRQYQQRSRGHAHLVQVLTVGETADTLYYVMEAADNAVGTHLASGEDYEPRTLTTELLRHGRLPLELIVDYVSAILSAVGHLHRSGLRHRDLKPSNVLFVDGALKVGDVGLATSDGERHGGTPGYLTPEGTSDDLYAVGVLLYEMLTGQPASRFPELPVDPPSSKASRMLLRIIDQACDPDAVKRFTSAEAFRTTIEVNGHNAARTRKRIAALVGVTLVITISWGMFALVDRPEADIVEWTDVAFEENPDCLTWFTFPSDLPTTTRLKLSEGTGNDGMHFQISGTIELEKLEHCPNCVIGLLIAVDDSIIGLVDWGVPYDECGLITLNQRRIDLNGDVLRKIGEKGKVPVYLVYSHHEDYEAFKDEYRFKAGRSDWPNYVRIGDLYRKY